MKPVEEFPRNRSTPTGRGAYCKPCHNRITRENKEKHGGARNYHLRRRYGITAADFDEMFAAQDGLCAICREAPAVHVDHDHETDRVRDLLCLNCNLALGAFRDRRDLMLRAINYLDSHSEQFASGLGGYELSLFVGMDRDPRPADAPPGIEWSFDDEPLAN